MDEIYSNYTLKDYLHLYHSKLVDDAEKTGKFNWNITEFMDYVWSKDPGFRFDADNVAVAQAYGSFENIKIQKEVAFIKIEKAKTEDI